MSFHAFISYSHSADGRLAPALQSKLERFATPWYARRRFRLFRDQTTLSATPALWPAIEQALTESDYLLVLASPQSADSVWVGREIEYWRTHKSPDHLLIVLSGGELAWSELAADFDPERSTALHPSLRGAFGTEPLWVDLRWIDDWEEFSPSDPRFVDAAADLASAISGRPKDELIGDELRQRRRARQAIVAGVSGIALTAVLAIVFAIFALVARGQAITQRNTAVATQLGSQSETLLDDDLGLGLLLAVAASSVGGGAIPAGRGALIGALEFSPHLARFIHPRQPVLHPVFASDGSAVALVGVGGTLTLRDPRTGAPLPAPPEPLPQLASATFGDGGRLLALGADDGSVLLWDRDRGELRALGSAGEAVAALTFDAGATTLTSVGAGSALRWDVASGTRLSGAWTLLGGKPALSEPNRRLGEEPLRRRLIEVGGPAPSVVAVAAADADRGVLRWWARPGAEPVTLGEHGAAINDIAISADGTQIATAGSDGRVVVWRVADDGSTAPAAAPTAIATRTPSVDAVDFLPDGRLLIATSEGYPDDAGVITLLGVSGRALASFPGHSTQALSLAVSADGTSALSAAVDGSAIVWDLRSERLFLPTSLDISAVTFSPDGLTLMTGTDAGEVAFWHDPTGLDRDRLADRTPRSEPIAAHGDCRAQIPCVSALAYDHSPARRWAASGGSDGGVVLYDVSTDPPTTRPLSGMQAFVEALVFSSDGRRLVGGDSDGRVTVWAVEDGQVVLGPFETGHAESGLEEKFTVAGSRLSSVVFSPDGAMIVTGGRDGMIRAWDAATGAAVAEFETPAVSVLDLAFSPDGRLLAAAGRGGVIDLFVVHTQLGRGAPGERRVDRLLLDEEREISIGIGGSFTQVIDVAFSPDSRLIASTYDTGVLLWDVATGRRITHVLGGYRGLIFDVEFSPDGSTLLVAGNDAVIDLAAGSSEGSPDPDTSELGTVTLRGIGLVELRARACAIAQRSLTVAEWARYIGGEVSQTCPDFPPAPGDAAAARTDPGSDGAPAQ